MTHTRDTPVAQVAREAVPWASQDTYCVRPLY